MFDAIVYSLFIGLPVLLVVGVGIAYVRQKNQTFEV